MSDAKKVLEGAVTSWGACKWCAHYVDDGEHGDGCPIPVLAALQARVDAAERHGMVRAAGMVPTTWLDPLLTGPEAIVGYRAGGAVQRLCLAIRDRIMAAARAGEVKHE